MAGKRLEDLHLQEDQPPDPAEQRRARQLSRDVEDFLDEIQETLSECSWARDTLEGIYDSVSRSGRVSDGQRAAVENIARGGRKSRGRDRANYFGKYQ